MGLLKEFKKQFAYVAGQKSQLWINLPAVDSFELNKSIYELPDAEYRETLGELVELFGVQEFLKVQVRRLSLGERMKMEMIAALLHRPKVILLDEPTIGLDFIAQNNIREFLKDYNRKNGATMLLTSHYLKDIEERHGLRGDNCMAALVNILASAVGSLTNPTKLANTFGSNGMNVSDKTIAA